MSITQKNKVSVTTRTLEGFLPSLWLPFLPPTSHPSLPLSSPSPSYARTDSLFLSIVLLTTQATSYHLGQLKGSFASTPQLFSFSSFLLLLLRLHQLTSSSPSPFHSLSTAKLAKLKRELIAPPSGSGGGGPGAGFDVARTGVASVGFIGVSLESHDLSSLPPFALPRIYAAL